MLEHSIEGVIEETFSLEREAFGQSEIVDLVPNGRNIAVTDANKRDYVQLMVKYRLCDNVSKQLQSLMRGLNELIPQELLHLFDEGELELVIGGLNVIDVDDWRTHTVYKNCAASDPICVWFWKVVEEFDSEQRARLLQFVTGTSRVPMSGFKDLRGSNGPKRFTIERVMLPGSALPKSHTWFVRRRPRPAAPVPPLRPSDRRRPGAAALIASIYRSIHRTSS